jgi:CRISPR-associated protein Cas2
MNSLEVVTTPLGWRSMWILALFDLPTKTKAQRKRYTTFRKSLLNDGFSMMQFSVYKRHCATRENASLHIERMGRVIPSEGEVRFIQITDRQFGEMKIFRGKKRIDSEERPAQLEFF